MIESGVLVFVTAASVVALTPGPGIFYVAARTLAGGRAEGLASCLGTGIGGLFHVLAGALGVSALVMASATAFTGLKLLGAGYLIWIGVTTLRQAGVENPAQAMVTGAGRAFRDGIFVEVFNPKTAAFFLAFIPQFIDPGAGVAAQFLGLGLISVLLNTGVDVMVALAAARAARAMTARGRLVRRIRMASGAVMCALGGALLLVRR